MRALLALTLVALALGGCAGREKHSSPGLENARSPSAGPTSRDVAWLHGLRSWRSEFARASGQADAKYDEVLGGTSTKDQLRVALQPLVDCPTSLNRDVGRPPTPRYSSAYDLLVRACDSERRAALARARSFEGGQTSALQQAQAEGSRAETLFEEAFAKLGDAMVANRPLPTVGGQVTISRVEPRLSRAASVIAHQKVEMRCWSPQEWERVLVEYGAFAGTTDIAGFAQPPRRASLHPAACEALVQFAYRHRGPVGGRALLKMAAAVALVAHETEHLVSQGGTEAETECYGMQDIRHLARILGANDQYAALLAETYWAQIYPDAPRGYWTDRCRNGGPLDARPASDVWP